MQQPAQIFHRVRHALQKMRLALVKAAKAVRAQGLHDAHVNVSVVVPQERFALELYVMTKRFEIMIEQILTHFRRQIGFGVEQKRSDAILQRPLAPTWIIHKKWLTVVQQDVPRLKIAI